MKTRAFEVREYRIDPEQGTYTLEARTEFESQEEAKAYADENRDRVQLSRGIIMIGVKEL